MDGRVRTGLWTNWSEGPVLGRTLTLSDRDGAFLLAFLALFMTVVSSQTWKIVVYVCHQSLVRRTESDAVHYQRQSILRNSVAPLATAWAFICQYWAWRRHDTRSYRRIAPWFSLAVIYSIVFVLATIFSSQVARSTSSARLLRSSSCGNVVPEGSPDDPIAQTAHMKRERSLVQSSMTHVRQCYGTDDKPSSCDTYIKPSIAYTMTEGVPCPFGSEICWKNNTLHFETRLIDSHADLGINTPPKDRFQIRQRATCAVLDNEGYRRTLGANESFGWGEQSVSLYEYGPTFGGRLNGWLPYTHLYFIFNGADISDTLYTVQAYWSAANATLDSNSGTWEPIPALASEDDDTAIIFIMPNAVKFLEANSDPIFSASKQDEFGYYIPDYYGAAVACREGHQLCNPTTGQCGPWAGRLNSQIFDNLDFNNATFVTALRLRLATGMNWLHAPMVAGSTIPLRVTENLYQRQQLPIHPKQWHLEFSSLFETSLARLQMAVHEYAVGYSNGLEPGLVLDQLYTNDDPTHLKNEFLSHCDRQLTMAANGTTSFSVLGLALILGIGGVLVLLSLVLEPLDFFLHQLLLRESNRHLAWVSDGLLCVQRLLLEARGVGPWRRTRDYVPVLTEPICFEAGVLLLESEKRYRPVSDEHIEPYQIVVEGSKAVDRHDTLYPGV